MNLLDANILVYAAFRVFPQHAKTKRWLDDRMNDAVFSLGIPWETLLAFVRLASNPKILAEPLSVPEAWRRARYWLSAPSAWIPAPTSRHRDVLGGFLDLPWMTSKLVADAQLAALAVEHGLVLCSADADFRRFPGVRVENPTV